jgi:Nucleotidyl transferase
MTAMLGSDSKSSRTRPFSNINNNNNNNININNINNNNNNHNNMPSFFLTHPRACAVILASSQGSRLFPLTTTAEYPKHLLPVAGMPSLLRLLQGEPMKAFPQVVVAIAADDTQTLSVLLGQDKQMQKEDAEQQQQQQQQQEQEAGTANMAKATPLATLQSQQNKNNDIGGDPSSSSSCWWWQLSSNRIPGQTIYVVPLSSDCFGPIDAIHQVEATRLVHPQTQLVVLPGDLVFLHNNNCNNNNNILDPLIRPPTPNTACISMLVDVLEQDEHGHTLKESAKVRKSNAMQCKAKYCCFHGSNNNNNNKATTHYCFLFLLSHHYPFFFIFLLLLLL